jgi:hypothetical protein
MDTRVKPAYDVTHVGGRDFKPCSRDKLSRGNAAANQHLLSQGDIQ